jgi:hypothetical protein
MDPRDFIPQAPSYFPPLPAGYEAARMKVSATTNRIHATLKGSPTLVLIDSRWLTLSEWQAAQ